MFGLTSGPKGDFPFKLNTPEWVQWGEKKVYKEEDEEGKIHYFPQLKYFEPDNKRPEKRLELLQWHHKMVKEYKDGAKTYIPEDELLEYCRQDVRILCEGFEKYRAGWLKKYPGLEVLESITLPSYINRVYRTYYMPKESIAMLPPQGYHIQNRPQSSIALAWMAWMKEKLGLTKLRTARDGGEVKFRGFWLDGCGEKGEGDEKRQVLFEFNGCHWHGCECQPGGGFDNTDYKATWFKKKRLQELAAHPDNPYGPFDFYDMWGCQLDKEMEKDPKMQAFIQDYLKALDPQPFSPRAAFKGGRTNAVQHQVKVPDGWKLLYMDVNSLYPSINFGINGEEWPLGHPDIYIGSDVKQRAPPFKECFGGVRLTIIPPKKLMHPVLGETLNSKFVFHLCHTCAVERTVELKPGVRIPHGPCRHTDKKRAITGDFIIAEIQLALTMGYKIQRIHELWNWPKERRSKHLFRDFIRDQYADKVYASVDKDDEAKKTAAMEECKKWMDLNLEDSKFSKDPTKRLQAKFLLNNFWGFFGKKGDVTSDLFTHKLEDLRKLERDPKREVTYLDVLPGGRYLYIQHKPTEEPRSKSSSVILAAMTAAYARIHLYKIIAKYPSSTVYFDTGF